MRQFWILIAAQLTHSVLDEHTILPIAVAQSWIEAHPLPEKSPLDCSLSLTLQTR
jgi:hypothetical protein